MTVRAPVVYVGPTLSREAVERLLPSAVIKPPLSRSELYVDRVLGYSTFLILDGAFFQRRAVSPREVIDVLEDGARVFGAASMGALRAAECWPKGLRGVGAIYRLFRRGILTSDDEVAVVCDPEPPYRTRSVALVNVRYAVRRGVQAGELTADAGDELIRVAQRAHFSERRYPELLARSGLPPTLAARLTRYDLKAEDARRAVLRVRRFLEAADDSPRSPDRGPLLRRFQQTREAELDPLGGRTTQAARADVARFLWLTGRYRRYTPPPRELRVTAAFERRLWRTLEHHAERDAELFKLRAHEQCLARGAERGAPPIWATRLAEASLASEHGFRDFAELLEHAARQPELVAALRSMCRELALAKLGAV